MRSRRQRNYAPAIAIAATSTFVQHEKAATKLVRCRVCKMKTQDAVMSAEWGKVKKHRFEWRTLVRRTKISAKTEKMENT